jgi:hypothetical protein
MPTVLRKGPYRFFFFSREPYKPAHIHVEQRGQWKFIGSRIGIRWPLIDEDISVASFARGD